MSSPTLTRVDYDALRAFTRDIFEKLGVPERDADVAADALVHADLLGIDSHGVARLAGHPGYVPGLKQGMVRPVATPFVVQETTATALLDGDSGLGGVGPSHDTTKTQDVKQVERRARQGEIPTAIILVVARNRLSRNTDALFASEKSLAHSSTEPGQEGDIVPERQPGHGCARLRQAGMQAVNLRAFASAVDSREADDERFRIG